MKRYIKSSTYKYNGQVIHGGTMRYFVYWNENPLEFQMTKIAPYDDAEYVWAKYSGGHWCNFYKDGKQIDQITIPLWYQHSEDYEDFDEYLDAIFDIVLLKLEKYNKEINSKVRNW